MKKMALFVGFAALSSAVGCGDVGYPIGSSYNGTTTPHSMSQAQVGAVAPGQAKPGGKTGEACASGVLGIAAWGDASTSAAKKAAGVTDVHSVEFHGVSYLGIYTQGCTVVTGQ